jgi:hypothetical protein
MPRKKTTKVPTHRAAAVVQTVWVLLLVVKGEREIIGVLSSEAKAKATVDRLTAKEAGLRSINLPDWTTRPDGAQDLVHGRDRFHWWFRLEPWPMDGEI